jgi:hypothetical protein
MTRTKWLLSILFVLCVTLYAQAPRQRAYDIGYKVGYARGFNDGQGNQPANATGTSQYQDSMAGWTGGGISASEYSDNYQAAFKRGYGAGYGDGSSSAEATPDVRRPEPGAAYSTGYQFGYK